ncbi:MAG: tripartite tricarboxylate transporter permease [Dehalobacterium sp.]
MLEHLALGIDFAFEWHAVLMIFLGVLWGIIGGVIPGINATVAMSLILPFTWGMPPHIAIMLLLGVYAGAEYGGSVPACLIGTPGTNAAACTVIDGYEMTKKGRPGLALGTSLYSGVIGGMIGNAALIMLAIPLATVALAFGPAEYCALAIMGLTMICALGGKNVFKGILAGVFGMFLATVGIDMSGVTRFTFGIRSLNEGFNLIPVMMGLFAVTEVLKQARECFGGEAFITKYTGSGKKLPSWQEIKEMTPVSLFAGVIGTIVGVMPGVGASTSSFIAYNETKRWFKNTESFGQGEDVRAIAAPESANNAVTGSAMVPLLSLGIPGSNSTAIMLGALMLHNVVPGPMIFERNPEIAYGAFVALFIANIFMLFQGLFFIKIAYRITTLSKPVLLASIIALVFTGAYAVNGQVFDIFLTLAFGLIGYGMKKIGLPPTATVLGFVLGPIMENNLRRALIITDGSYFNVFFGSTLSTILIVISLLSLGVTIHRGWHDARREKKSAIA